jgi:hypothetical protein
MCETTRFDRHKHVYYYIYKPQELCQKLRQAFDTTHTTNRASFLKRYLRTLEQVTYNKIRQGTPQWREGPVPPWPWGTHFSQLPSAVTSIVDHPLGSRSLQYFFL